MVSNPIEPPSHAVAIVMRASYLEAYGVRGKCIWHSSVAVRWLKGAYRRFRQEWGWSPRLEHNFRSYIAQALAAKGRAVCLYASLSSDMPIGVYDRWTYAKRRSTVEHEHAHAEMGLRQVLSKGRWFRRADIVMYAVAELAWLDVKEEVEKVIGRTKRARKRKPSTRRHRRGRTQLSPNDQNVNESLARVAAVMTALDSRSTIPREILVPEIARYQLWRGPKPLLRTARAVEQRFGSFGAFVEYIDGLLGLA